MNSIFNRRSIRKYTTENIPGIMVDKILKAAMSAPSAGNQQPWHFIVVKDNKRLDDISNVSPYAGMIKDSIVSIIVCADVELEKHKGFWVQDCSAAVENMLIEITELGLGGVWLGIYPIQERVDFIKKEFNLPENVIPLSIVPIGYPGETKEPSNRYNASRVHYEKW